MSERLVLERCWFWFETLLSTDALFRWSALASCGRRQCATGLLWIPVLSFFVCRAVCRLRDTIDRILASDRALSLVVAMVRPPRCGLLRCAVLRRAPPRATHGSQLWLYVRAPAVHLNIALPC